RNSTEATTRSGTAASSSPNIVTSPCRETATRSATASGSSSCAKGRQPASGANGSQTKYGFTHRSLEGVKRVTEAELKAEKGREWLNPERSRGVNPGWEAVERGCA